MPNIASLGRFVTTPNGDRGFIGEVHDSPDYCDDDCRVYLDGGGHWFGRRSKLTLTGECVPDYSLSYKKAMHGEETARRQDEAREATQREAYMRTWCS